jgi:hypothetical protein
MGGKELFYLIFALLLLEQDFGQIAIIGLDKNAGNNLLKQLLRTQADCKTPNQLVCHCRNLSHITLNSIMVAIWHILK